MVRTYFQFIFCSLLVLVGFSLTAQDSLSMERLGQWDPDGYPTHGGLQYNDLWGYTTETGEEYAIIGNADSILVIDVTDCSAPKRVFSHYGSGGVTWRDIKTYGSYAYSVCDGCSEGMHIFDLSALPDGDVTHVMTTSEYFEKAHNIYIDEPNHRLYAVGVPGGTDVIAYNLEDDPEDPEMLLELNLNDVFGSGNYYIHDIYVKDNIAYCSHGNPGFNVYNFTYMDVDSITELGSIETGAYNHSSWTDEEEAYAYFAEEVPTGKPMGVIDLANLGSDTEDISIVTTFADTLEETGAPTPHNPYVVGDYLYISYYEDGTKVYDITDRENPALLAYYDTYLDNDGEYTGYEGNWGTYPFFTSGCIISSDIIHGLNTLQVDWGLTDTCTPVVELDGTEGTGTYSASNHLRANGVIPIGDNVTYMGVQSVELNSGFHLQAGSEFEAKIEACQANTSGQ